MVRDDVHNVHICTYNWVQLAHSCPRSAGASPPVASQGPMAKVDFKQAKMGACWDPDARTVIQHNPTSRYYQDLSDMDMDNYGIASGLSNEGPYEPVAWQKPRSL